MVEEEISPAALPLSFITQWWKEDSTIITHTPDTHRILSADTPLPPEYTIKVLVNECSKLEYCMLGLSDKLCDIKGRSYLGERELGVLGFCFSNVTNREGNWEWHNSKVNVKDEVVLCGDYLKIIIFVNGEKRQTLKLQTQYSELYLACHLYGVCNFEIIEVLPSKLYNDNEE